MSSHLREQWARVALQSLPDLPDAGMFERGKDTLDPRIFVGDEMKPVVRDAILSTLAAFWNPLYPHWHDWAKVYVAGSAASYWWSSDVDLDCLIGIDVDKLREDRPANIGVSEVDICAHLDHELKTALDPHTTNFQGIGLEATFFVNPGSYDIRAIKPYAAFDVTDNVWVVRPPKLPADWGPRYFPEDWWRRVFAISDRINDLMDSPEPLRTQEGVALFDQLHFERNQSYGPNGHGWTDWGNFAWQALSQLHQLQKLYRLKHPGLATAVLVVEADRMSDDRKYVPTPKTYKGLISHVNKQHGYEVYPDDVAWTHEVLTEEHNTEHEALDTGRLRGSDIPAEHTHVEPKRLCEATSGPHTCDKEAVPGSPYCQRHKDLGGHWGGW